MVLEEKLQNTLAVYDQKTNNGKDPQKEAYWQLFTDLLQIAQTYPYVAKELLLTFAEIIDKENEPRSLEKNRTKI